MTIENKINAINRYVKGTLCITHSNAFGGRWEITSFGDGTVFNIRDARFATFGYPTSETFAGVVEEAHRIIQRQLKIKAAL